MPNYMTNKRLMQCAALLLTAILPLAAMGQSGKEEKVLRIVPHSDLKILDPVWTTAFITRNHGYAIYDTLFGVDAQGVPQPQMVETYTTSSDGNTWDFTLRAGLAFHDGAPVTGADVAASIQRWGQRDILGQRMLAALQSFEATGANSFRMVFRQPFGMVLEALGKPSSIAPFIMPARVAATAADQQITDYTGSGPYIFDRARYRPGEIMVYHKNPRYVPRAEPPSGTAGGKQVYVDRMEWIVLRDAQTQASALINGEVDMLELMPVPQYEALKKSPAVRLGAQVSPGSFTLHLNHIIPPFDKPEMARAAIMAINQSALLRAQIVHKELYRECTSIYFCDSAYAQQGGSYFSGKPQFARAKELLQAAGYDGTPVVLMFPGDVDSLNKFPPVMAQLLQQAGFKVDLQSMDWSTLVTRRAKKDAAAQGGWNAFITYWTASDTMNPLFFAPMTGNGEKGWFGWATDPKLEQLKSDFLQARDARQKKTLAAQIQNQVLETGILAPIGESQPMTAYRAGVVEGEVHAPVAVFWNLRKKQP